MPGYRPDLAGISDPQIAAVLRRNLDAIAYELSRRAAMGSFASSGQGGGWGNTGSGSTGNFTPEWVQSRHLDFAWEIEERVAVTEVIMDSAEGAVVFSDADTVLVEIAG